MVFKYLKRSITKILSNKKQAKSSINTTPVLNKLSRWEEICDIQKPSGKTIISSGNVSSKAVSFFMKATTPLLFNKLTKKIIQI